MSDPKDFVAVVDSDARKTPRRIAFITKRTSPQVRVKDEDRVMTYPEVFFRTAVAIEVLAIALVIISLRWNAPLEGLADPMHTPNPGEGALVLPRIAGIAALLPAGRGRRSHTGPGGDGADRHPVLQHQRRSRRLVAARQGKAFADLRHCRCGLLYFPGGVRCLGRAGSDPHRRRIHAAGRADRSRKQPEDFVAGWSASRSRSGS